MPHTTTDAQAFAEIPVGDPESKTAPVHIAVPTPRQVLTALKYFS